MEGFSEKAAHGVLDGYPDSWTATVQTLDPEEV